MLQVSPLGRISASTLKSLECSTPAVNTSIDGRYIVRIEGGKLIGAQPIGENACVISPADRRELFSLLSKVTPVVVLATVINDVLKAHGSSLLDILQRDALNNPHALTETCRERTGEAKEGKAISRVSLSLLRNCNARIENG